MTDFFQLGILYRVDILPMDLGSRKTAAELLSDPALVEGEYVVAGWAEHIRVIGRLVFIVLRDRTGRIQLVVRKNVSPDAWKLARENSFSSNLLDSVFMYAIKVGRRAREETGISRGVIGYPKAGIIASRRVLGDFKGKNVLILGAGKAGRIITEEICKLFPKNIIVANRSLFKASELLRICPLVKPVGLLDIPPQKYDCLLYTSPSPRD
jgi:hypothetical protein